jgi:hypothetical protein
MSTFPSPFQVNVPDNALDDLRKRLELTRFPDELDSAGWAYGAPLADIKRLVERWVNGYDWRAAEREINKVRTRCILHSNHVGITTHTDVDHCPCSCLCLRSRFT